jgi:hypothetical protein
MKFGEQFTHCTRITEIFLVFFKTQAEVGEELVFVSEHAKFSKTFLTGFINCFGLISKENGQISKQKIVLIDELSSPWLQISY